MYIQETQLKINTLLERIEKDVSLERSSESEVKNAPGTYMQEHYTYVATYICIYIHVYKVAIVRYVRYVYTCCRPCIAIVCIYTIKLKIITFEKGTGIERHTQLTTLWLWKELKQDKK